MFTHSSTIRPVRCLSMAEWTGCSVSTDLGRRWLFRASVKLYTINNVSKAQVEQALRGKSTAKTCCAGLVGNSMRGDMHSYLMVTHRFLYD
jgi:hypothetical protein